MLESELIVTFSEILKTRKREKAPEGTVETEEEEEEERQAGNVTRPSRPITVLKTEVEKDEI